MNGYDKKEWMEAQAGLAKLQIKKQFDPIIKALLEVHTLTYQIKVSQAQSEWERGEILKQERRERAKILRI